MNLQTLQAFHWLLHIFLDFLQAKESPPSFRIFFYEFTTLQACLKLLNIFLEFLQPVQSSSSFRIFSMSLQTLQAFLKLQDIFLEFLQAAKGPPRFRIIFYEFANTPGITEVTKYFSRISTSCARSSKLQNIILKL